MARQGLKEQKRGACLLGRAPELAQADDGRRKRLAPAVVRRACAQQRLGAEAALAAGAGRRRWWQGAAGLCAPLVCGLLPRCMGELCLGDAGGDDAGSRRAAVDGQVLGRRLLLLLLVLLLLPVLLLHGGRVQERPGSWRILLARARAIFQRGALRWHGRLARSSRRRPRGAVIRCSGSLAVNLTPACARSTCPRRALAGRIPSARHPEPQTGQAQAPQGRLLWGRRAETAGAHLSRSFSACRRCTSASRMLLSSTWSPRAERGDGEKHPRSTADSAEARLDRCSAPARLSMPSSGVLSLGVICASLTGS